MAFIKHIAFFFSFTLICSCGSPGGVIPVDVPLAERPKNVILMIGDGMGLTQVSAALYKNGNKLSLEKFPVIGFHKSHSYDKLVSDSAAVSTAFSCGLKTY